jgi:hypothetical protein
MVRESVLAKPRKEGSDAMDPRNGWTLTS